ncbi:putative MFS transporter [Rhizodiscina lignyota]|uniref:MFS transporter n=1 Tax=Rhizodiscina lignyota TaxID=1504668 RepID=A0A9P4IIN4_9PEZI|nr:putative MFS transporter [Rhizodiscina lignyota]
MADNSHKTARIIAVAAATTISLACGTNYAYSAWSPQFADKLRLSSTESNIIGAMGNMGMYAMGIPVGMLVDSRGPRPAVILGGICLGLGYFPLKKAFDGGEGSMNIALLAFFSFVTGLGSCSAFSASIKAAALNWPQHRGTATGLALSAFGLSALFFTMLSAFAFPGNTSGFLLLLSIGTPVLVFVSLPFLRVPHPSTYTALATSEEHASGSRRSSNQMRRPKPSHLRQDEELSKQPSSSALDSDADDTTDERPPNTELDADESSSLMSAPGDVDAEEAALKHGNHHLHHLDISGRAILSHVEFYQLFILLGSLTGVGLMTINNIGNDAQALWAHWDPSVDKAFISRRQLMHVSIISSFSFIGRLISGIGSDLLVKRLRMSRFWCITVSSSVFIVAQIFATQIQNPNFLWVLSLLTGTGYGALFGVYPALVADAFGMHGLSLNWGSMIISPVIFGNAFNIAYGRIYDNHSRRTPDGKRSCPEGLDCYRSAYFVSFAASVLALGISLWSIHHEHTKKRRLAAEAADEDHQA